MQNSNRRKFIQSSLIVAAAPFASAMAMHTGDTKSDGTQDFTCLFQGDSITDGNRGRNNDWNHVMGHGYAYLISSRLWYDHPKSKFHFFNRGVSGNKVTDLQARWQQDALDIKPNLLSILIGINDVSVYLDGNTAFSAAQYETGYTELLQQAKDQIPGVQFVLCEPFILPVGKIKDRWSEFSAEIAKRQEIVKNLSVKFNALYVTLQDEFNKACSKAPADFWIFDGVHPMPAGHELIARQWIDVVSKKIRVYR